MAEGAPWVDLLDPTEDEVRAHLPVEVHPRALDQLVAPAAAGDRQPRPTLENHGPYVFGVFLVPVAVPAEDGLYYQEIDLVLTKARVLTVRKSPQGGAPFDVGALGDASGDDRAGPAGLIAFSIVDGVAEGYLSLSDDLHDEIDEMEDHLEVWPAARLREHAIRLRHDLLHTRRVLAPTRDAVHRVVDGRIDLEGERLFTHQVELYFTDAYDKLLRASDAIDLARDLIANIRDAYQTKLALDQNEVTKRLTVVASLLLLPTFIVGLYGQNFIPGIPEYEWGVWGYVWSWSLITATTILQLVYYRRKGWF